MTDIQTLQLLIDRGIIKIDDDVVKKLDMDILKDFQKKIWQATDGRYKIKMPDGKLLAKKRKEDLDKAIIDWQKTKTQRQNKGPKFKDLYIDWLNSKKIIPGKMNRYAVSESTRSRYICFWNRHYKDNDIINMYVKDITKKDVQNFLDQELYKYKMTARQVNNIKTIIKQTMDLAVDRDIIDYNPVDAYKLPINTRKEVKPDKKTQVFNAKELSAIYNVTTYRHNKSYIVPLMIELAFKLGLRNGELVALKWTDLTDADHIYIQRSEIKYYEIDEKGNRGDLKHDIGDPKTQAGYRTLFLDDEAKAILAEVKAITKEQGVYNGDWIFNNPEGDRYSTDATDKYIRRACAKAGVLTKSMHKIRKTTLSKLIAEGMSYDAARVFAGHSDPMTIHRSYIFDLEEDDRNNAIQAKATKKVV